MPAQNSSEARSAALDREPLSLTFDDGPDARWTRDVLRALERARARATFFMLGERVDAAPDVARAVLAAGHDLQLHGYRHLRHSELDEPELRCDTRLAIAALARVGARPTLWRTPWGARGPATESLAACHGLTLVDWTIDTHDWRGDAADTMLALMRPRLDEGGVVLMHDAIGPGALRDGCANTVELVEPLIEAARASGTRVETLACGDAAPTLTAASTLAEAAR